MLPSMNLQDNSTFIHDSRKNRYLFAFDEKGTKGCGGTCDVSTWVEIGTSAVMSVYLPDIGKGLLEFQVAVDCGRQTMMMLVARYIVERFVRQ